MEVEVLGAAAIRELIGMGDALACVEGAYRSKVPGQQAWPLVYREMGEPGAFPPPNMDIRSGSAPACGLFGCKLISEFPGNRLGKFHSVLCIFSMQTGEPVAFLEGLSITRFRTGAAAAVGARALALPGSRTLAVVGTGSQCPAIIAAVKMAVPTIGRVVLWNPRSAARARERLGGIVEGACAICPSCAGVDVTVAESGGEAFAQADIVVTATGSTEFIVEDRWVRPGTHISCIGADMPGKQELDPRILLRSRVVTDDRQRALEFGELNRYEEQSGRGASLVAGELGQVLRGELCGRRDGSEVTVFAACGLALLDLSLASLALERARKRGMVKMVEW